MNNIEKEFNKRFQYKVLPDDDFDVEGLWNAIEPEIKRKKRRQPLWMFLFGLILMGSLGYFLFNSTANDRPHNNTITYNKTQHSHFLKEEKNNFAPPYENIQKTKNSSPISNTSIKSSFTKKENTIPPKRIIVNHTKKEIANPSKNKKLSETIIKSKSIQSIAVPSYFLTKKIPAIKVIGDFKFNASNKDLTESTSSQNAETQQKKNINWTASVYSGLNLHNQTFKVSNNDSFTQLKNNSHSAFYGNTFGFKLQAALPNHWIISSGIEYNNLWSKFAYEAVRNFESPKTNQLLRIEVNMDGDTLNKIFGDTVVNATGTRTVIHYNQNTNLTIPVLFGFQQRKKNFLYGISIGGAINFQLKQAGKTLLSENEIIEYNSASTQPNSTVGFNLRTNLSLGYYLSDQILLSVEPMWMFSRNSFFQQKDVKVNNSIYAINLGVGYLF